MSLRSFFGFLPTRLYYHREELSLEDFPVSEKSILLIEEGGEVPLELDLKLGDSLKSGQGILSSGGEVLSFSTVTGKVEGIESITWSNGERFTAVSVAAESDDEWDSSLKPCGDFLNKSPEDVLSFLSNLGFSLDTEGKDSVIVNCLDGDLLISNSRRILSEYGDNIRKGIGLLRHIYSDVILAISEDIRELAEGIVSSEGGGTAEVSVIRPVHPNGMAEMLSHIVSEGESVVIGVEYLNAMIVALETGRPFVEKMITLIDKGCKSLKNMRVRIGTPASEIIKANNIPIENGDRVVLGGPMTGRSIHRTDFPITDDTDALFIQGSDEITELSNTSCLNCGKCVKACPYNLQVNLLSRYSEFSLFEKCEELDIDYCIECGLCAYVCSARRPLVQFIQFARKEIERIKAEEAEEEETREEEVTA